MATTEAVKTLIQQYDFQKALIVDDAFDGQPDFDTLDVPARSEVGDLIDGLPEVTRAFLNEALVGQDLREDDWEAGLSNASFLAALWKLKLEESLTPDVAEAAFGIFAAERAQKLAQLAPLQALLRNELKLIVEEVGRDGHDLPQGTSVVFLDLFLGVTGQAQAREQAADRIKELLRDMKDQDRPLVVLMSNETGKELEDWAKELRGQAALLGAKFRVISKSEFDTDGPLLEVLEELLAPLEKTQALAGLIDEWGGAMEKLKTDLMADLRNLDLSDCAYLKQFRLQAEGMPLGTYLVEAYGDVLRFRLEGCLPLITAAMVVDGLDFNPMPPAHFLPSEGVNWLTHAMHFVNEKAIAHRGYQFPSAATLLELGDVIIKKPHDWAEMGELKLGDGMAIYVVISQSCDLQQNKSDAILLLQGTLRGRTWDDPIKPSETRVDCFRFRGHDYVIEWEKARLDAWQKLLANRYLKLGGPYLRIARLRTMPALKAQHIFSSNLTRIGTLANPHMVVPVGVKILMKDKNKIDKVLLNVPVTDEMACLLKGIVVEGKRGEEQEHVVFKSAFGLKLGKLLLDVIDEFNPQVRESVREFAQSSIYLAQFRAPLRLGRKVVHGQLKIDIKRGVSGTYSQNVTIEVAPTLTASPLPVAA
jgi:hypothetical protein